MSRQLAIFDSDTSAVQPLGYAVGDFPISPVIPTYQWHGTDTFQVEPTGRAFRVKLAPEGIESSDGRLLQEGSIWTRQPPLPLMFLNKTTGGHQDAVFVGNILRVWRENGWIMGEGVFDTSSDAREAVRLVSEGRMNRVSIDTAINEIDEEAFVNDGKLIVTRAELMGATIVPFAAFGDTLIEMSDGGEEDIETAPLVASIKVPVPDGAFSIAESDDITPVTITEDGKIYGHLALWGTCHQGISDRCVIAPKSMSQYAHFLIGKMGNTRVGVITMDTVHASQNLDERSAERHYADTGTIAAYVTIIDGKLGPWISGFVEPSLDDAQLRRLQASGISGDWRYDRNTRNLELVAILAVPTPGFSVPRFERDDVLVASVVFSDDEECVGCQESKAAREELDETLAEEPVETEAVEPETDHHDDDNDDDDASEPEVEEVVVLPEDETDEQLADELGELLDSLISEVAEEIESQELDKLLVSA